MQEKEEEFVARVHPLRQAGVYVLAPMILMDTFLILFTSTLYFVHLGGSEFGASLIIPIYTGVNMLTELFWGWMADTKGRRPPLIVGAFFSVPALALFAFATEPWQLLVASAIRGIGGAAGVPISKALVADLAPRKVLGERMGAYTMTATVAPLVGITASGILYDVGRWIPFIAAAITEFVSLLLVVFVIPETVIKKSLTEKTEKKKKPYRIERFRQAAREWSVILRRRGVAINSFRILMGTLVGTAASGLAFPLFATSIGLSPSEIGFVTTSGLLIMLAGSVPAGQLSDRIGRKWPTLISGFWEALKWPFYTLVPLMAVHLRFTGFISINVLGSIGAAIGAGAISAYFYEWIRVPERARASALTTFVDDLGITIGFPLVGWIYEMHSPSTLFWFVCIAGIITYLIIWAAWKEAPSPGELKNENT